MPPESVMGCWTESSINLVRVWFGSDLQIENQTEVSSKVTHIVKSCYLQWLSLKGWTEVAIVFISLVIIYRRCSFPRFVLNQARKTAIPLLTEVSETIHVMFCLLQTIVKVWSRTALAVDVQAYSETEAPVAPPRWGT